MPKKSYCTPFLDFVGRSGDPHECWQEDGFWPDRSSAELEHLLVWGTEIGLSYFKNGGMTEYLKFTSGCTLPEVEHGCRILGCLKSQQICAKVRKRFGDIFPRDDTIRSAFVDENESFFYSCEDELLDALKSDDFEALAEAYYEKVCLANSIPPVIYPDFRLL